MAKARIILYNICKLRFYYRKYKTQIQKGN